MSERLVKQLNPKPLARFVSYAVAVPARSWASALLVAIPKALELAGLTKNAIDWFELNEAFAAQSLAVLRDLDPTRLRSIRWAGDCAGASAGVTGAIRTATLVHGCVWRGGQHGYGDDALAPVWAQPACSRRCSRFAKWLKGQTLPY